MNPNFRSRCHIHNHFNFLKESSKQTSLMREIVIRLLKGISKARWALLSLILLSTLVYTLTLSNISPAVGVEVVTYSGSEYTLADYPSPFISTNSSTPSTYVIIPSSTPHGPCGSAHTMDTMGGVSIAYRLGIEKEKSGGLGTLKTAMDGYSYISTYDTENAKVTMTDTISNLIVIGGPGINQVTYYFNELKDGGGSNALPVNLVRDVSGDYLYVQSSGHEYHIEVDGYGTITADYSVIQIYRDEGRHILLIYGLGGEGTRAAANVLSDFSSWNLTGIAAVVKYYDSDGDGFLDTTSIVEDVPPPSVTIEVYHEAECINEVSSIDWGDIEAGSSKNVTVYIKNLGDSSVTLYLSTQNWSPPEAQNYMSVDWDYDGSPLNPEAVLPVSIILTVSEEITDITTFSLEIIITCEG
jgi:hypothetical protein